MLYSSCKNSVVEAIQKVKHKILSYKNAILDMELTCNAIFYQLYSIDIAKKVEVDGGAELTEDFLHSEIHPVITINIITFHIIT